MSSSLTHTVFDIFLLTKLKKNTFWTNVVLVCFKQLLQATRPKIRLPGDSVRRVHARARDLPTLPTDYIAYILYIRHWQLFKRTSPPLHPHIWTVYLILILLYTNTVLSSKPKQYTECPQSNNWLKNVLLHMYSNLHSNSAFSNKNFIVFTPFAFHDWMFFLSFWNPLFSCFYYFTFWSSFILLPLLMYFFKLVYSPAFITLLYCILLVLISVKV